MAKGYHTLTLFSTHHSSIVKIIVTRFIYEVLLTFFLKKMDYNFIKRIGTYSGEKIQVTSQQETRGLFLYFLTVFILIIECTE
jgi:hypothetical protein